MQGRNIDTEDLKESIRGLTDGLDLWDDDNDWLFQDAHFYLPSEQETRTLIDAHRLASAEKGLILVSARATEATAINSKLTKPAIIKLA